VACLGSGLSRSDLEAFNFHVCVADREEELIRSLGVRAVEQVLEAEGELRLFRSFQNQRAQRERPHHAQLHRFMGTRSGRKVHHARRLVMALDPDSVPHPLVRLLARV
jgi:hypothetical protein